jgi:hypothetical protein
MASGKQPLGCNSPSDKAAAMQPQLESGQGVCGIEQRGFLVLKMGRYLHMQLSSNSTLGL